MIYNLIAKASNAQALRMAQAGIEFVRISKSCYALFSNTTMKQLQEAGLRVRAIR